MIAHLGLATLTFLATNIDDLLILALYFTDSRYKTWNIVAGQYLGISSLVAISLTGLLVGAFVPSHYVSLLGIVPLLLGVKGIAGLYKKENERGEAGTRSSLEVLQVALVTVANGGDNIGVYTPLFATTPAAFVYLYVIIFLILTGLWCLLSHYLVVSHSYLKGLLERYGKIILPVFLILLGLSILKNFCG